MTVRLTLGPVVLLDLTLFGHDEIEPDERAVPADAGFADMPRPGFISADAVLTDRRPSEE